MSSKTNSKVSNKQFSFKKQLRREGKSTEEFEMFLNNLSLEELIALKLDLASTTLINGKLFGLPLWQKIPEITKEACFNFAMSACKNRKEAAMFLGITRQQLYNLERKYRRKENQFISYSDRTEASKA